MEAKNELTVTVTTDKNPNGIETNQGGLRQRKSSQNVRCISKEGSIKFRIQNVDGVPGRLLQDILTSLLDLKWRWTLLIFCLIYFGTWLLFALFWLSLLYLNGDFTQGPTSPDRVPCVDKIQSFGAVFLFSVETQHTTGYGFYQISDECPAAIILLCIQSIVGVILEGVCVGVVFIKVTRAKKRRATLIFSKKAVVSTRDGKRCLMFRVGDVRTKSHLVHTQVQARVIRRRTTVEGEIIQYDQQELSIHDRTEKSNRVFLFWPLTVAHILDESSPLGDLQPSDLSPDNTSFEVMVVLEGVVESTGLTVQARSSYLPSEILWGHRFQNIHSDIPDLSTGQKILNYSRFHETYLDSSGVENP